MPSEEKGRQAAAEGRAHEHIAVGLLMKRYQNVSLVDLPLSPYDIIIVRRLEDGQEDIIRAQVKTAKKSVSFIGGVRGGVDRTYKSDVKRYRQSTATSDVVLGVKEESNGSYSLYVVPTCLIEALEQDSIGLRQIEFLKNNWEMLERCKDRDYVLAECARRGIVRPMLLEMDEE